MEWEEYATLEPFGPLQEELRSAIPATLIANQWRQKGQAAIKADELFPSLKQQNNEDWFASAEGQVALAKYYVIASGGTINDG